MKMAHRHGASLNTWLRFWIGLLLLAVHSQSCGASLFGGKPKPAAHKGTDLKSIMGVKGGAKSLPRGSISTPSAIKKPPTRTGSHPAPHGKLAHPPPKSGHAPLHKAGPLHKAPIANSKAQPGPPLPAKGTAARTELENTPHVTRALHIPETEIKSVDDAKPMAKTIYSHTERAVFFMGIDGSGHHFWLEALKACKYCEDAMELRRHLLGMFTATGMDILMQEKEATILSWTKPHVRPQFRYRLLCLNNKSERMHGTMSYPLWEGKLKGFQHPHIRVLAEMAERVKADLRLVLMMHDPAESMLVAARRHYGAGDFWKQQQLMTDNLAVIFSQLQMVDAEYVACFDLHAPEFKKQMHQLEDFLGMVKEDHALALDDDHHEIRLSAFARQSLRVKDAQGHLPILDSRKSSKAYDRFNDEQQTALMELYHTWWPMRNLYCGYSAPLVNSVSAGIGLSGWEYPYDIVSKSVSSSKVRFAFFAGVYGGGHLFWNNALKTCKGCIDTPALRAQLWKVWDRYDEKGYKKELDTSVEEMRSLTAQYSGISGGSSSTSTERRFTLLTLNTMETTQRGLMAYPHMVRYDLPHNYPRKPGEPTYYYAGVHPNVRQLAEMAERAFADLRVVLLLRDPAEILGSSIMPGYEGSLLDKVRILTDNALILNTQLQLIDKAFIVCFDISQRKNPAQGGWRAPAGNLCIHPNNAGRRGIASFRSAKDVLFSSLAPSLLLCNVCERGACTSSSNDRATRHSLPLVGIQRLQLCWMYGCLAF
eukprot:jgi/Mesvir1/9786/Mv09253-RA.1